MQLSPSLSALAQCSRPQQAPRRFRPAHCCFRTTVSKMFDWSATNLAAATAVAVAASSFGRDTAKVIIMRRESVTSNAADTTTGGITTVDPASELVSDRVAWASGLEPVRAGDSQAG